MCHYREELLRYTEHKIREVERPQNVGMGLDTVFDSPKCPMIVINMASTITDELLFQLKSDLFSTWPHFREVIPFLSKYDESGLNSVVEALMQQENGFDRYNELRLYFIVDTTELSIKDGLTEKINEICRIRECVEKSATPKCILYLLHSATSENSEAVRNAIRGLYEDHHGIDYVVVVSNKLQNGALVSDYKARMKELITIILMTNGSGGRNATATINLVPLNQFKVVTLQAKRQEKPRFEISQVIITSIFEQVQNLVKDRDLEFDESRYLEKIGIDNISHFFRLFEKYFEGSKIDENVLDYFPIDKQDKNTDISILQYDDLNRITFNTLEAFLEESVRSSAFFDPIEKKRIAEEYRNFLYESCSLWELKAMQNKVEQLTNKYLEDIKYVLQTNTAVVDVLNAKYKYGICASKDFYSLFFEEIKKLCENAQALSDSINGVINEIGGMRPVSDALLSEYYRKLVDEYKHRNEAAFEDLLKVDIMKQADTEKTFIEKIKHLIDLIIETNSEVFCLPYVKELRNRLASKSKDIASVIREEIIVGDDNTSVYYCPVVGVAGSIKSILPNPPVLLINTNGELKPIAESFQNSVINTKSDSFIEKIDIFELKQNHI